MLTSLVNIKNLIDDQKCYEAIRVLRWSNQYICPHCDSPDVMKRGKDDTEPARQRYSCKACEKQFDDLTGTIFAGQHQSLKMCDS